VHGLPSEQEAELFTLLHVWLMQVGVTHTLPDAGQSALLLQHPDMAVLEQV
jgi:hypothetical protein